MPINSEIRKALKKGVGDSVSVVLYPDNSELIVPDEFLACLSESPNLFSKK